MADNLNNGPVPKPKQVVSSEDKKLAMYIAEAKEATLKSKIKPTILGRDSTASSGGTAYKPLGYGTAANKGEWGAFSAPEDMALEAFQQQSTSDLVTNAIVGFGKRMGAGFLDSIGAWDVTNMTSMAMDKTNVDYTNWFNRLGKKITENANEENQIYQDPSGSIWNGAYWANQTQQLGYTAGIIAEMVAENLALDWITGGAQNVGIITKYKNLKNIAKDGLFGMAQGVKEAHMNALETQQNTYEKFKQLGFSDDIAMSKSREAANLHFKTEAGALAVMNGLQNAVFLGSLSRNVNKAFTAEKGLSLGFSDAFQNAGEAVAGAVTKNITNKTLKKGLEKTLGYGLLSGSEAVEEAIQTGIGTYAERKVQGKDTSWDDLWKGHEMRDSMIGGALGGLLMGAGFKGVAAFRNREFNKNYKNFFENMVNSSSQMIANEEKAKVLYEELSNKLKNTKPDNKNITNLVADVEKAKYMWERAKQLSHANTVEEALQFDHGKGTGSTVAFDMYVQHLEEVLEAVNSNNIEDLKNKFGLIDPETGKEKREGSLKYIQENYKNNIEEAQFIKNRFAEVLSKTTTDFGIARGIVQKQYSMKKNTEYIQDIEEVLNEAYGTLSKAGLSKEGLERLKLLDERQAILSNEAVKESADGIERLEEIKEALKENSSYTRKDRDILTNSGVSAYQGVIQAQQAITLQKEAQEINNQLLQAIYKESTPESIRETIKNRRKQAIKKAKTKAEVQEVKQEVQDSGETLSEELEKEAQEKERQLAIEQAKQNNLPIEPKKATKKVVERTGEVDEDFANDYLDGVVSGEGGLGEVDNIESFLQANEALNSKVPVNDNSERLGKAKQIAENLDRYYNRTEAREASLEDFVHELAALAGLDKVKKGFKNLVSDWGSLGRDISAAKDIYNSLFVLPIDYVNSLSEDSDAASQANTKSAAKVSEEAGKKKITFEGEISSGFIAEDSRTTTGDLKAAHNHLDSVRTEDGVWVIAKEGLKIDPKIGNNFILDPQYMNELVESGKNLTIRINDDDSTILSIPDPNNPNVIMKKTWGEVKEQIGNNNLAYAINVPMIAYDGDIPLFNIHSPIWYNWDNISDITPNKAEVIEEGYQRALALRQRVLQGKDQIKLEKVRPGSIDNLKEHMNDTPKTLTEASKGTSTLLVKTTNKGVTTYNAGYKKSVFDTLPEGAKVMNKEFMENLPDGTLFELRLFGDNLYIPLHVLNYSPVAKGNLKNDLQEDIFNNVKYVTIASLILSNKNNATLLDLVQKKFNYTLSEARELQNEILKASKIDIATEARKYVELFLDSKDLVKRENNPHKELTLFESKSYKGKNGLVEGITFYNGQNTTYTVGKISDGKENVIVNKLGEFLLDEEGSPALLRKSRFSLNLKGLQRENFFIPTINAGGRVEGEARSYDTFAKDHLYSTALSHEIKGQDGSTKVIGDVQPMIYFEPSEGSTSAPFTKAELEDPSLGQVDDIESFLANFTGEQAETTDINDTEVSTSTSNVLDQETKQALLDSGLSLEDIKTMIATGVLGVPTTTTLDSRITLTPENEQFFSNLSTNKVTTLTSEEQNELVQSIKNIVISKLDFNKKLSLKEVSKQLSSVLDETVGDLLQKSQKRYESLSKIPTLTAIAQRELEYSQKLEAIIEQKDKLIRFNKEGEDSVGDIVKEFNRLLSVKLEEAETIDDAENTIEDNSTNGEDNNYSKSHLEKPMKLSFSVDLRLNLLGFKKEKNGSREVELNSIGLPKYNSADEVEARMKEILTSIRSDWNLFMDLLESKYTTTGNPIYIQIRDHFKDIPSHIKNEILNKMIQEKVTIIGTLQSEKKDTFNNGKSYVVSTNHTALNENFNSEFNKTREALRKDFKYNQNNNLGFVKIDKNGVATLDVEYTEKRIERLQELLDNNTFKNKEDFEQIRKVADAFGLLRIPDNALKKYSETYNPFRKNGGIFYFINEKLKKLVKEEKFNKQRGLASLDMLDNANDIMADASTALKSLIQIDTQLNKAEVSRAIRVGGNTYQGTSNSTMIQDILAKLKEDKSEQLALLNETKLGENNYFIKLLEGNEEFKNFTDISWVSPNALKLHGSNSAENAEVDTLGESDYIASLFAQYSNQKGMPKFDDASHNFGGINFRGARMSTTTFADKGRLMLLNTAVVDAKEGQIEFDEDGKVTFNPILGDFLYQQLFVPEFNRIVEAHSMKTDINSYDTIGKVFVGLPMFNEVSTSLEDGLEIDVVSAIKDGITNPDMFKESAVTLLENFFTYLVNNKISVDGNSGTFQELGLYKNDIEVETIEVEQGGELVTVDRKESHFRNLSDNFINSKPGETAVDRLRFALVEFDLNTILNQNNIYSSFLGDQAFYGKDNGKFKDMIANREWANLSEAVSLIIDKRAAMLIAPGTKYADSEIKGLQDVKTEYTQIFVNDVEGMSDFLENYIETQYGEVTERQKELIAKLQDKKELVEGESKKDLEKELKKSIPDIADYLNITGTDAQEYSTWKSHLDALYRKGDLTEEDRNRVMSAYTKMSKGDFDGVTKEEYAVIMQPLKTVYTNLIKFEDPVSKAVIARPIYIKSSTLPLLPQVTKNLKIDEARKALEALENDPNNNGRLVKMSYQTANKIGATKTNLNMSDFYDKSFEELNSEGGLLSQASVTLPTTGLRIQQETPYKQGKYFEKGQDPHISMGSQFMKVIMGNGMNKMGDVFHREYFNPILLKAVGIDPNIDKLSGKDLEDIYNHVYQEYSNTLRDLLYDEFKLDPNTSYKNLTPFEQRNILVEMVKILEEEIQGRGYPEYMEDSLKVLNEVVSEIEGNANFDLPLLFDANTNKFEALLQGIISNRLISHKLPGNGHISASSEGFSKKAIFEELSQKDKDGIVWINGIPNALEPTYFTDKDGKKILVKSKVLIPSHYAYDVTNEDGTTTRKYIDFTSEKYSKDIIEDGKVVGRALNTDMIDKELLEMFAFRIPTSSHQSGVIIEVAGFLPEAMGDALVVPREHTTQLGEDYDIDKRYVYKSNYYINEEGVIKKIGYNTSKVNAETKPSVRKTLIERRLKSLENSLIDVYKTVYTSTNTEVQKKIFKPLVTEVAEKSADIIEEIRKGESISDRAFFSNLTFEYQQYLIKLGADGKGGIGVHSNGVTAQAQYDRAPDDAKVTLLDKEGYQRVIRFGKDIVSDGVLGDRTKAHNSDLDVADQHGENQNVSTDNINKQIMIKRNENSYTMGVFAVLAHRGIYTSPEEITYISDEKIKKASGLSIPSFFMSQPILFDYVKLRAQADSITGDFVSPTEVNREIIETLAKKYNFYYEADPQTNKIDVLNFLPNHEYEKGQDKMTMQNLVDSLKPEQALKDPILQASVLQHFMILADEAQTLQKYNSLINLSTSKLGISNFLNIQRVNLLNDVARGQTEGIQNVHSLIGDFVLEDYVFYKGETPESMREQGYTLIGDAYWKPTTLEGIMLINSLKAADDVVEHMFPYKSQYIDNIIKDIFANNDKDPNKKSRAQLEWKYEIINSMRDFFYTSTKSNMFNNVKEERQRIFIDSESNMSIASIINNLRITGNDIIKDNELIKDFELTIRHTGQPSLIQHFAQSNETFDKSVKYEAFKKLLQDDTTDLGLFNGETLTPRKLAFDLFSYAYLADSQRGASSFRNYIYYGMLQEMGITDGLRSIYNNITSNTVDAKDRAIFLKQYFQHNPSRAKIMSDKTFKDTDIVEANAAYKNASGKFETNILRLTEFTLKVKKEGENPQYISVRHPGISVDDKKKMYKLYEKQEGTNSYKEVPVLGDIGFNEYDANATITDTVQTGMTKNKRDQSVNEEKTLAARKEVDLSVQSMKFNAGFKAFHTVPGIINVILTADSVKEQQPELRKFVDDIKNIINTDIEIKITPPSNNTIAQYVPSENIIKIHPSIWEILHNKYTGIGTAEEVINMKRNTLRETLVEEIVHANTHLQFMKYVESNNLRTGDVVLREDAPEFAKRITALYESARAEVPYDANNLDTYYSKNIDEFMAGMFVSPEYRNKIEEKSEGIIARFLDALRAMFKFMYKEQTGKVPSYKEQLFKDVASIMKEYKESVQTLSNENNDEYAEIIGNNPGEKIKPSKTESPQNLTIQFTWARRAENSYEVSSKGDTRFSALNAKLKDGRTIEEAYQLDIKGYRAQGDNWRLGKGKAPLTSMTKEQTWQAYKNLWRQFLQENPKLEQDLREKAVGKVLTDMFASTDISQARALAELLNEKTFNESKGDSKQEIINNYYEGDITPDVDTIFVFGSNPEGRHGAGAAKIARDKFGAIYGQGEGLQGNAYALPTKDLRVKENKGFKSISPSDITESIKKLYQTAISNPNKQFKVAYRNTITTSLNGYTGLEMIEMFKQAGPIPSNIVFSKEWYDVINNTLDSRQNFTNFAEEAFKCK